MNNYWRLSLTMTLCLGVSSARCQTADDARPNIICILVDDMGFSDLGCYGSEIRTPNLDRLAAGGVRFTQFYNTARCCPTRASLLTGLYPHQAGMGGMDVPKLTNPGYLGRLAQRSTTIAEVLRQAGYRCYMTGKWHLGVPFGQQPLDHGFHAYYGILGGACDYFNPHRAWANGVRGLLADDRAGAPVGPNYYTTDAFTDHAMQYLEDHQSHHTQKPFFLYMAYNAPHWPLHALPEDIARYKGRYLKGWDVLREQRYRRMIEMGIIDSKWPLSPRGPAIDTPAWKEWGGGAVPAWDSLTAEQKEDLDMRMAVYAAMIDRMDQNIGRLVGYLERTNQLDNTLILFMADNGGALGGGPTGFNWRESTVSQYGSAESFLAYGTGWANASNTPLRKTKCFVHEGGISTPLIAHWPKAIKNPGRLDHEPGHVVDIMPTCIEVAGAEYPRQFQGHEILPAEGSSLAPILRAERPKPREAIYWEHTGNRAVRLGKWKLVAVEAGPWELYDIQADRTELNNLALQHPEKVRELTAMYNAYAERAYVEPWPIAE